MSRKTEQDRMDAIRAARGLPPLRDTRQLMMEQAAAARCYLDRAVSATNPATQRSLELRAFMSIFHPEYSAEQVTDLLRDA